MVKRRGDKVVLDDSRISIPVFSPICTFCRHHKIGSDRQCAAFPNGIPMEIWLGRNKHSASYPGDQGIQFQISDNVVPEVAGRYKLPLQNI